MGRLSGKRLFLAGGLAVLLAFFAWIYGWGGGPVRLLDIPAETVECIRLSDGLTAAEVTDPADIQALVEAVNAFRHTGNEIKNHPFLLFGFALGGTRVFEFQVSLKNGETFTFCFGLNRSGQDPADTEVSYWVPGQPSPRFGRTCRGSMERIYGFLEASQVNTGGMPD